MRRQAGVFLLLVLAGCGRYADFQIAQGQLPRLVYLWSAEPSPVIPRGPAGSFDAVDVLNPSVIFRDGHYWNLYSGFDGRTWHTGLASSADGRSWTKSGRILSPDPATWEGSYIAANGSALILGSDVYYWYQAGNPPRIGLARSTDLKSWTKEPHPVLDFGPRGAWDERAAADPYVIRFGDSFYLYYLGEDRARRQRLGVARSQDGIHWTRLRTNPILELGSDGAFDENGLGEPAVWPAAGGFYMLYTGRARNEVRRMGLARSPDGVRWERTPLLIEGTAPWNAKVVCDATVLDTDGVLRVWFGGGDVPHPAENIHGQIGFATLNTAP